MTTPEIVGWVIESFEGHLYTDDPVDTGGATRWGITLRTLRYYRQRKTGNPLLVVTKADVKALTLDEAIACGVEVFAREHHIDDIPDWRVRLVVYDYGFHSGQKVAIKALQRALNVEYDDGIIGSKTVFALNAADPFHLAIDVLTRRERFMQDLTERKPTQRRFLFGWWRRTTRLQEQVL